MTKNTITFAETNKKIDYWYTAEGTKTQQVNIDGATVTTPDYIGEFVFENNALSYIPGLGEVFHYTLTRCSCKLTQ